MKGRKGLGALKIGAQSPLVVSHRACLGVPQHGDQSREILQHHGCPGGSLSTITQLTCSVGKTSLMNQYVNKRFSNQYKATIGKCD